MTSEIEVYIIAMIEPNGREVYYLINPYDNKPRFSIFPDHAMFAENPEELDVYVDWIKKKMPFANVYIKVAYLWDMQVHNKDYIVVADKDRIIFQDGPGLSFKITL